MSRRLSESRPAMDRFVGAELDLVPYTIDYSTWYRLSGMREPLLTFYPSMVIDTVSLLVHFSNEQIREEG